MMARCPPSRYVRTGREHASVFANAQPLQSRGTFLHSRFAHCFHGYCLLFAPTKYCHFCSVVVLFERWNFFVFSLQFFSSNKPEAFDSAVHDLCGC